MRFLIAIFAVGVLIDIAPADAAELCGEAPSVSDRTAARGVSRTAEVFKVSAAAGKTFADLAATFYLNLSAGHSAEEARSIAGALLHASCIELTRGEDPAKLPWRVKDKLAAFSTLVPDFHEAAALLARIKAAETQR